MKQKKPLAAKVPLTSKPAEESAVTSALSIVIGIAAVSVMALIIIWMMNALI